MHLESAVKYTGKNLITLITALILLGACNKPEDPPATVALSDGEEESLAHQYGDDLGSTRFSVSCSNQAKPVMERALALLHHMTYTGAEAEFSKVVKADPACALAYWGVAMSYIHPLWNDPPSTERLQRGLELLNKAADLPGQSEREAAYISATLAYYDGAQQRAEPESLVLFRDAWEEVYRSYPDDIEAASFYALSLMGAADTTDTTLTDYSRAGLIVEDVLTQVPDHPAGHHYLIHAYDSPSFASQALLVARNYSEVAPEVPHALHMPTHIFTRLGFWDDSIAMNDRSAVAAESSTGGEYTSSQMLHAQDYMVYAHLQKADEAAAMEVLEYTHQLQGPWDKNARGAAAYAFAAMPARFALERRDWAAAATLEARQPESFPWSDDFAPFEAISWFSRGLGAALDGQSDVALASIVELNRLKSILVESKQAYWVTQVDIQLKSIEAWNAYRQGDVDAGIELMRKAAVLESGTFKHPITPGEILPANELYADMLLEMGEAEAALTAYQHSMDRSPNRFNSLYGAAMAAETLGDSEAASAYFGELVEMTSGAQVDWERLKTARERAASYEAELTTGP
jgi:tetratricopeptide (TPR) repeat protein